MNDENFAAFFKPPIKGKYIKEKIKFIFKYDKIKLN